MKDEIGGVVDQQKRINQLVEKLYFNEKEKFNKVSFLFFDGILYSLKNLYNENGTENERAMYASRTTFMNLFDINNDLFILSTNSLTAETISNYALVQLQSRNQKNEDFSKISSSKKELTCILQDMRQGKLFLDPTVPFKINGEDCL